MKIKANKITLSPLVGVLHSRFFVPAAGRKCSLADGQIQMSGVLQWPAKATITLRTSLRNPLTAKLEK